MRLPVVALGIVMGCAVLAPAQAKPRPADFEFFEAEPEPCPRGKTWERVSQCLRKQGSFEVIHDRRGVKIVALDQGGTSKRLALYAQRETEWVRGQLNVTTSATNEVVSIEPYTTPLGEGLRIDLASAMHTRATVDSVTSQDAVMRRQYSNVCTPREWTCRTLITICEVYVRGKLFWQFRGEVIWHPSLGLRMRGDTSLTGGACRVSPALLIEDGT